MPYIYKGRQGSNRLYTYREDGKAWPTSWVYALSFLMERYERKIKKYLSNDTARC